MCWFLAVHRRTDVPEFYWVHKISAIHREFHGHENVPLCILISATDLEVDDLCLMTDLETVSGVTDGLRLFQGVTSCPLV
jgi:hypothetical protein